MWIIQYKVTHKPAYTVQMFSIPPAFFLSRQSVKNLLNNQWYNNKLRN